MSRLPMRYLTALCALLTACALSAPEKPFPLLSSLTERSVDAGQVFPPESGDGVTVELDVHPVAALDIVKPPTPCSIPGHVRYYGGNAAWVAGSYPVVGSPMAIKFQMTSVQHAEMPAWVLVTPQPPNEPLLLDAFGMSGCHMLVNPGDLRAIVPTQESANSTAPASVTRRRNTVFVRWTPPAWAAGLELWLQMVWADPNVNSRGYMWSDMVHMRVGTTRPEPYDWAAFWEGWRER